MNIIDPFAPDYWIRARLLATAGGTITLHGTTVAADAVAFCRQRIAAAREGFSPLEFLSDDDIADGKTEANCWPYILFGPSREGLFDRYAQEIVGLDAEYLIRAFHREDYAAPLDVEQANWPGFIAIQSAFQSVPGDAQMANDGSRDVGIIHGCEIQRLYQRLPYLPPDAPSGTPRISELGVFARIFAT